MIGIGLNLWRRGGGINYGNQIPVEYMQRIANTGNDGREYTLGGGWLSALPPSVQDVGGPTDGIYGGLSFESVNIAGGVSSASLRLVVTSEFSPGVWTLTAESNGVSASTAWGGSHLPNSATPTASAITGNSTAVGTYNIDVTQLVNEVMTGAAWNAGQRINFMLKAPAGGFASCAFAHYPSTAAATLTMTSYVHKIMKFDESQYLYKNTGTPIIAGDGRYGTIVMKVTMKAGLPHGGAGTPRDLFSLIQASPARQLIRLNVALHNDDNTDLGINSTDLSVIGFKDSWLADLPLAQPRTFHIAFDSVGNVTRTWVDGVETGLGIPAGFVFTGTVDFSAATLCQIAQGGNTPGIGGPFNGYIGLVWVDISNSASSMITDPTLFYRGGDVNLGTDGTRFGRLPAPKVFYGGAQEAADWQAGTNQGTAGDFTAVGTFVEVP